MTTRSIFDILCKVKFNYKNKEGTIAAAAVINEIIAVIFAKKGYKWERKCGKQNKVERTKREGRTRNGKRRKEEKK